MSAADLAAVLLSIAGVAVLVMAVVVGLSLLRTLRAVRSTLERLRSETMPLVEAMRETVEEAGAEVAKVEVLVERTEEITSTLDASTRVVDRAVTAPIIKTTAVVRGVGRGLRRSLVPGGRRRAEARRAQVHRMDEHRDERSARSDLRRERSARADRGTRRRASS